MNTDGTGFYTRKECHQTEPPLKSYHYRTQGRRTIEDQRKVGDNSCNSGDGKDQRVQSFMFMMMMMMMSIL